MNVNVDNDKFHHLREYAGNIEKVEECNLCPCKRFSKLEDAKEK